MTAALALSGTAGLAAPQQAGAQADATLFVELIVNGRAVGDIVPLRVQGAALLLERDALRRAGVQIEGGGEIDVAGSPGLTARYDAALQRIEVMASPELLPVNRIAADGMSRNPTTASAGALINYDLYAMTGAGSSASLWSEQRLFGPLGVVSNSGVLLMSSGAGQEGYRRYDTFARYIDEDRARAVTAGDFISQSLAWTRAVRMGGVQISRAFRVRPDLVTMPLPSFAGETAVPTAVDLFVNGFRQQTTEVTPGRFILDSVPVVTGAGQAMIVTTDAVGRQIQTTIPFYVSAQLLRPGLSDFSFEAGWLRRNYGLENFDYGSPAANASARYGLSPNLTLEAHAQGAEHLAGGGFGVIWAPGRFGTMSASWSGSDAAIGSGSRWSVAYEYTAQNFGLAYQHDEQSARFRDLGDLEAAPRAGRTTNRFVGSVNLERTGSVALAYIDSRLLSGPRDRIVSASYQRAIGERATLLVTADHDLKTRDTGGQVRVTIPFGRNTAGAAVSHVNGRTLAALDYGRSMPTEGGLGVDAGLATDQRGKAYGQGSLTYRTRNIELQAGGAFADRTSSGWVGATGAVVFMDGGAFTANQASDAFAVVSTGLPGVGVFYENQLVGATGRGGRLFVPNVVAYQSSTFAIDTLMLSEGYVAATVSKDVAVRESAGAVIRMPVRQARSILVIVTDPSGAHLEPGGSVERSDGGVAEVGWDGLVYLEDVPSRLDLTIDRRNGTRCTASVVIPDDAASLSKIGPVTCV